MTFVVQDDIANGSSPRSSMQRARVHVAGTGSAGPPRSATSPTTEPERSSRRWRRYESQGVGFAASTIWVILAAILVIFMQAGFAFLEAGLTRMKNVGHIAAKNVLILAIASIVYYCVGFGIAFGDGGNGLVGGSGFFPTVDELLTIGEAPFSWFSAIPAAAGYLFEVAFAAVSLAIVWGAMAERTKLWVYFAFGAVLHAHLLARLALDLEPRGLAVLARDAGLRRVDRRPLPGCARGPRGRDPARAAARQVRVGRQAERDPRSQHGVHDARRDHPLVRLVRLQPGLDPRRSTSAASASSRTSR